MKPIFTASGTNNVDIADKIPYATKVFLKFQSMFFRNLKIITYLKPNL